MPQSRLTGHQKLGLSLFVVIGLATFVLGAAQIRQAVAQPFVRKADVTYRSQAQIEQEQEERLKSLDTDSDGLNDYDELYVFRTSPYLEDSDSDSLKDGDEIAANSDPNCPRGRDCRMARLSGGSSGTTAGAATTGGTTSTSAGGTVEPPAGDTGAYQAIIDTFGDPTALTADEVSAKIAAMSSEELRSFLVRLGIPEGALAQADDATLKSLLAETMAEIISQN